MATYFKLDEYKSQTEKENAFINGYGKYVISQKKYNEIPGKTYAYWISKSMIEAFEGELLKYYGNTRQGFATGKNDLFLRFWFEVEKLKISRNGDKTRKWFFCNKGGSFRKWYGNISYVANWENDGIEMKKFPGSVIRNEDCYLKEGLTWSSIANDLSMRYSPDGFVFESKGSMFFSNNKDDLLYFLATLNSKVVDVFLKVLSPTLDYHEGPMSKVPIIYKKEKAEHVKKLAKKNLELSKQEWDEFEISDGFLKHPLL